MQEWEICDKMQLMERKSLKKKIKLKWILIGIVTLLVFLGILIGAGMFHIDHVEVTGNSYYTEEEIERLVLGDHENSLYFMLFSDPMKGKEIPFVDKVEVQVKSADRIHIRVYEKTMIGYIKYMGSNLYFDKDGTVVESSDEVLEGIPCIEGMKVDGLTLYQPMNVKNSEIFDVLLSVTQMMKKYELEPDGIVLQNSGTEIVLVFGNVQINLGKGENMDEKASRIQSLLPDLADKSGVLHMEEYTSETTNISFIKDK